MTLSVIRLNSTPAKAGVQSRAGHGWAPAFAGVAVGFMREGLEA